MKEHVGNTVLDGKFAPGGWTDKRAFEHMHFEENLMQLFLQIAIKSVEWLWQTF